MTSSITRRMTRPHIHSRRILSREGLLAAVLLALLTSTSTAQEATGAVLTAQLYRVRGNISGKTSLTDNIFEGLEGFKLKARQGAFTFFTLATLTLGDVKLEANEKGWTWDGEPRPKSKHVSGVASPRVSARFGEPVTLEIGSAQPLEYFERRPDGLFELKKSPQRPGLSFSARFEEGPAGRVIVRNLTIVTKAVTERERIEDVSLNVGKPVVKEEQVSTSISLKPDVDYGVQYLSSSDGVLFLRLRVTRYTEKTGAATHGKPRERARQD